MPGWIELPAGGKLGPFSVSKPDPLIYQCYISGSFYFIFSNCCYDFAKQLFISIILSQFQITG